MQSRTCELTWRAKIRRSQTISCHVNTRARARTHTHVRFSCINILPTSHCTSHGQTTAEAMHHCSPALLKRRVNVTQHLLYSVTRCGRLWGDGPRREQSDGGEAGHYHYHCLTFLQGFAHFLCQICSRLFPSCEFLKTYYTTVLKQNSRQKCAISSQQDQHNWESPIRAAGQRE